jgi:hypothetical protein
MLLLTLERLFLLSERILLVELALLSPTLFFWLNIPEVLAEVFRAGSR